MILKLITKNAELKKAFKIGIISISSYIACYYMRHILGVATPSMIEAGIYTKEFIGTISSLYLLAYAIGQLINGVVGDRVNPKYMVSVGLFVSGLASIGFVTIPIAVFQVLCFIIMGFALSMLRGPLVKVISENTLPKYAQVCCTFFSFAGFMGPLIASLLAILFDWNYIFIAAGVSVMLIAIASYGMLMSMENKGLVVFNKKEQDKINFKGIFKVFSLENFAFYMIIGALVEISAASIGFWIPTYMNERMGFSPEMSGVVFSIISLIKATTPFIALFVFRLLKNDQFKMLRYAFFTAFALFVALILVTNKYLNIVVFLLALMSVGSASTLLWSVYIPSQGKTGLVSTVNGVLDFSGYAASFVANMVFTYTMSLVGWTGIILMWAGLMLVGGLSAVFHHIRKENIKKEKSATETAC